MENSDVGPLPVLPAEPEAILGAVLAADRRVLLTGPPGTGKSTLAGALARALVRAGRACWCIGADPGSPRFGVPGAVCLGHWDGERWVLAALEGLCTLDAGRFRLPLISAVARLGRSPPPGTLLVDGPGVVRGVAGAELLLGMVQAADIALVLAFTREDRAPALSAEVAQLPVEVVAVRASDLAQRSGKRARARERTALWDAYLAGGEELCLPLGEARLLGTPPPLDVPAAWVGRQVALAERGQTLAMGEVRGLETGSLRLRVPAGAPAARALWVRDAQRLVDGLLGTSERFVKEPLAYLPPPDVAPDVPAGSNGGPRVVGRVGVLSFSLVNGVFGDPLLHLRLRHARRSLLFDLGEGSRLPARIAHQVSDVFITHAHVDHVAGFLWLLRSRIGDFPACRIYGPPGLAENIEGLTRGILWDRVAGRGPGFDVFELHGDRLLGYRIRAGRPGCEVAGSPVCPEGILLSEPAFRVRAATLDHGSPVLAFAFEPACQINVRKDRLRARGLAPGPWLGELKRCVHAEERDSLIRLPGGGTERAAILADQMVLVRPGKKLVYATDFGDTPKNRRRVVDLAHGAHTFFCEASFRERDADQAKRTSHLTTRACAEIAEASGVARLIPFHFSRRYEDDPASLYEEIEVVCTRVAVPRPWEVFEGSAG